MQEKLSIDIVLPAYNPEPSWYSGLLEFSEKYSEKYQLNFFIVNDGSKSSKPAEDISLLVNKGLSVEFISYEVNRGKGFALRTGVAKTKSKYIVYTDIDFPFTPKSVSDIILTLVEQNADIAVGYREGDYYKNDFSNYRKVLSKSFRFFLKTFLRMPITDTQCGLKGFSQKGRDLFLKTTIDRYLFDFEFIYLASRNDKYKLVAVPVTLKDNIKFSKMKMKVLLQESANLFKVLVKHAFKKESY